MRRALAQTAPPLLEEVDKNLHGSVQRDINFQVRFWNAHQGRAQEVANQMNDNYLRFNGIQEGILSYGLVVDLLLAYYEGELS